MSSLTGRRVAVVNWRDTQHSLAGGAELYAWEFAKGLVAAGAQVDFVTAREPAQSRGEVRDGIRVVRRGGRLTYYAWALLWLLRHRHVLDAVLDADCGIPCFSPLVLSRRRTSVLLLVHHVHLDQFALYFPPPAAWLGRFLEGRVMPRAYRGCTTIAVSASTEHEMVERLHWREPVVLLHNGNATREPVPLAERADADRVVVLGRLAPHKRVTEVVRAVGLLRESRPALHLDVIGKGPDQRAVEDVVAELGLEEHVTVHGFLEDHEKELRLETNRLHVCASDVEGWGQVVIEAASVGVPTLARDVPGMRDSVRPGETGWLLDEADARPLAERLAEGIDDALRRLDDLRDREAVATACRTWASQFSWEAMHEGAVRLVHDDVVRREVGHTDT